MASFISGVQQWFFRLTLWQSPMTVRHFFHNRCLWTCFDFVCTIMLLEDLGNLSVQNIWPARSYDTVRIYKVSYCWTWCLFSQSMASTDVQHQSTIQVQIRQAIPPNHGLLSFFCYCPLKHWNPVVELWDLQMAPPPGHHQEGRVICIAVWFFRSLERDSTH